MRSIRKLALLGLAALMVCAAVAASASATTILSGGVAYSGGITGTLKTGTNAVLSGPFGATITCTSSSIGGTTTSAGVAKITSIAFSSCTNSSGSCSVTAFGADGVNTLASTNNWFDALAAFDATHTGGRDGTLTVDFGNTVANTYSGFVRTTCGFITCNWTGTLNGSKKSVQGNLFNSDSTDRHSSALSSGCGSGTWVAQYVLKTSGGALVTIAA
jgi:hypothetical protein